MFVQELFQLLCVVAVWSRDPEGQGFLHVLLGLDCLLQLAQAVQEIELRQCLSHRSNDG